jgi:predicted HicB family RNase H-like nuclease
MKKQRNEKQTHWLTVRITKELREAFGEHCKAKNIRVGTWVKNAMTNELEKAKRQ